MAKLGIKMNKIGFRQLIVKLQDFGDELEEQGQDVIKELASAAARIISDGIMARRQGWLELSEITKSIKGTDLILIDSAKFVESITAWKSGSSWLAGLPESAVGNRGEDLHKIGAIHEYGAAVPVTDGVRKFFKAKGFYLRADTKYIIIPPRPWFEPSMRQIAVTADELLKDIRDEIAGDLK